MKRLLLYFFVAMVSLSFSNFKKQKVIFFGDSITQMGVNAGGYITSIDTLCTNAGLKDNYEFVICFYD
jgi:hypothetical protein